jgi:hypothetical protein
VLLVVDPSGGHEMCFRTGDDQRGSGGTSGTEAEKNVDHPIIKPGGLDSQDQSRLRCIDMLRLTLKMVEIKTMSKIETNQDLRE